MRQLNSAAGAAANLGRSAARGLFGGFGNRVAGAALASLKLWSILLLGGVAFVVAVVAAPVLIVVFAMTVGVSHGIPLDVPALAAPGPPLAPGELACPVPGASVTQAWGPSDLPGEPAKFGYSHFHTGIDLGVPAGTPIRAAEPGQVLEAAAETDDLGMLVGYGNLVR